MIKTKAAAFTLLIILVCSTIPALLLVNGQGNKTVEENMVRIAEKAGNQISSLIATINLDANAATKIESANLAEQFQNNITLYETTGLTRLSEAKEALANYEYNQAADLSLEALTIFRTVYNSLQNIIKEADIQIETSDSNQEVLAAIQRELLRIEALQNPLPEDTPQSIITLLEDANNTLLQAKTELQNSKDEEAKNLYLEAKQDISQVYQYLKETAEYSNVWRLSDYCEGLQERTRERFRYGKEQNIDLTTVLASLGYQSETEFMNALSNQIQNAKNQQDIQNAIQQCQTLSQLVQNMENAVNQEINRHHGQQGVSGNGGSGSGYGSGSGSGSGGNGGGK